MRELSTRVEILVGRQQRDRERSVSHGLRVPPHSSPSQQPPCSLQSAVLLLLLSCKLYQVLEVLHHLFRIPSGTFSVPGVLVVDIGTSPAREHHRDLEGEYHRLEGEQTDLSVFQKWNFSANKGYYIFHRENG